MAERQTPAASKSRKRVRFSGANPSGEGAQRPSELIAKLDPKQAKVSDEASRPRTRLPGEDDEDAQEHFAQRYHKAQQGAGPVKDVDPGHAAKRRAAARAEYRRRTAIMDVSVVPSDLAAGEEDYDEPAEMFLTGNIPVEPFHLRREREEGYFDASGNYVEYRAEGEEEDAWLDALNDMDPQQLVQGELANRLLAEVQRQERARQGQRQRQGAAGGSGALSARQQGGASAGSDGEEEDSEGEGGMLEGEGGPPSPLAPEDLGAYKARLAALLQPGETPISAIRRLGHEARHQGGQHAADKAVVGQGSTAARQRARKQQLQAQQQLQQQAAQAQQQQQQQQQVQTHTQGEGGMQGQQQAQAAAGGSTQQLNCPVAGRVGVGESLGPQQPNRPQPQQAQHVPQSQQSQQQATQQQAPGRVGRPVSSVEFDKLVDLADRLLGLGDFNVYSKSREQLLREAGAVSRTVLSPSTRRALAIPGGGGGPAAAAAAPTPVTPAEPLPAVVSGSPGEMTGGQEQATTGNAHQQQQQQQQPSELADDLADLEGLDGLPESTAADVPATPGTDASSQVGLPGAQAQLAAVTGAAQAHAADDLNTARPDAALNAQQEEPSETDAASAGTTEPVAETTSLQPDPIAQALAGFQLDEASGLYYNSVMGVWYSSTTQLFMDAGTGGWYRLSATGDYQAVPEAGQGLHGATQQLPQAMSA